MIEDVKNSLFLTYNIWYSRRKKIEKRKGRKSKKFKENKEEKKEEIKEENKEHNKEENKEEKEFFKIEPKYPLAHLSF